MNIVPVPKIVSLSPAYEILNYASVVNRGTVSCGLRVQWGVHAAAAAISFRSVLQHSRILSLSLRDTLTGSSCSFLLVPSVSSNLIISAVGPKRGTVTNSKFAPPAAVEFYSVQCTCWTIPKLASSFLHSVLCGKTPQTASAKMSASVNASIVSVSRLVDRIYYMFGVCAELVLS